MTQTASIPSLFWDNPMMATDGTPNGATVVDELLTTASRNNNRTLFVLSAGFDPRSTAGLARFIDATGSAPHVLAIDPQPTSEAAGDDLTDRRADNETAIACLATRTHRAWSYPAVHDEASAGRQLARDLTAQGSMKDIDTVVFDLSAFPTTLAFPMLNALLQRAGTPGFPTELLVLVTQNPKLDGDITEDGLGAAHQLPGFAKRSQRARSNAVRVWAPVLGRGSGAAMKKIADFLDPQEVCPVLPFPARDPRLADQLLLEHRDLIRDRFEVQPTSFIYAAETNPFDLYRTLVKFDIDYQHILGPIGGADVTLSSHGSKLLSIGALLAAYERKLQVLAVRATRRTLDGSHWEPEARVTDQLACVWLKGEPYDQLQS